MENGCSTQWIQFLGILVPLVAFFGFLYRELKDWRRETREEISGIREEINQQIVRTDEQAKRTDRLYEMFIDLLKETKCIKTEHKT